MIGPPRRAPLVRRRRRRRRRDAPDRAARRSAPRPRTSGTCPVATPTSSSTPRTGSPPLSPAIDALAEGRPVIAFATHGHFDHIGGLHGFADRRIHRADDAEARDPFPMRLLRGDFPAGTEEMFGHYDTPVPGCIVTAVPEPGFDVAGWVTPPAEATTLVDDGDVLRARRSRVRRRAHARPHGRLRLPVRGGDRDAVLRGRRLRGREAQLGRCGGVRGVVTASSRPRRADRACRTRSVVRRRGADPDDRRAAPRHGRLSRPAAPPVALRRPQTHPRSSALAVGPERPRTARRLVGGGSGWRGSRNGHAPGIGRRGTARAWTDGRFPLGRPGDRSLCSPPYGRANRPRSRSGLRHRGRYRPDGPRRRDRGRSDRRRAGGRRRTPRDPSGSICAGTRCCRG